MEFLQPDDWQEALEAKAAHPDALPLAGGTDVMVDLNFGRERPPAILDLTRVRELAEWEERDGVLRVGAGVSYSRAIADLGDRLPGLAAASRTVGSFHIRPARGPQQFSKIGTRNAMVIAVCSFALDLDTQARTVGTCIGSAAPTPVRALEAEELAAQQLDWDGDGDLDPQLAQR